VKVERPAIGGEHKAQGKTLPAFIEASSQGANAAPTVKVRLSKRVSDLLDQLSDFFPLQFGKNPQSSQQIGVEPNL